MTALVLGALAPGAGTAAHGDRLGCSAPLSGSRCDALPAALTVERPRLRVVAQQPAEDRLDLGADVGRLDGDDHLDAVIEVALHQVCTTHEVRTLIARLEAVEAAVLEKAAEDRAHADPLADA